MKTVNYDKSKWPIVYSKLYNVSFFGLEKLHPFDARKWGNIFAFLEDLLELSVTNIYEPDEATREDLLFVHTKRYLNSLKWGWNVAAIAEIPCLALLPNLFTQKCYLRPMRYQTSGSVLAGQLALLHGWALNIGGGFHHCSRDKGGGFCPYADITLLIENLFKNSNNGAKKAMIVDLDAHQGNGYARDFLGNSNVFIMDVYNSGIYPHDEEAKRAITCKVELRFFTRDKEYLALVERNLDKSLKIFHPDIIVYNAGTDILQGDPLGKLSITPGGIIKRDELVFKKAINEGVPIVMLTSGGYCRETAKIIADSINNLNQIGLIKGIENYVFILLTVLLSVQRFLSLQLNGTGEKLVRPLSH